MCKDIRCSWIGRLNIWNLYIELFELLLKYNSIFELNLQIQMLSKQNTNRCLIAVICVCLELDRLILNSSRKVSMQE